MPVRTAARPALLAAAAILVLAACDRAPEAPSADAPPAGVPASDAAPPPDADPRAGGPVDATQVVDRAPVAGAGAGFDVKAFAGTFAAEGADLRLAADGTYTLTVHAESADADLASTGTWTVEADGAELRLDPDSKDADDRRYTIASDDELVAIAGGQVLRRDGA